MPENPDTDVEQVRRVTQWSLDKINDLPKLSAEISYDIDHVDRPEGEKPEGAPETVVDLGSGTVSAWSDDRTWYESFQFKTYIQGMVVSDRLLAYARKYHIQALVEEEAARKAQASVAAQPAE